MQNLVAHLGWLLSPTRKVIDLWKKRGDRTYRGNALRQWSFWLFCTEVAACIACTLLLQGKPPVDLSFIGGALIWYACSRVFEIAYAFYRDPLSQSKESDLKVSDRIQMAMRSYFGLAFNFAVLYYFLPFAALFKVGDQVHLSNFLEAFYFSGVTLATLGYGDVLPIHGLSRLLALCEVFTGILIVAVAIAAYVGGVKDEDA